MYVVFLLLAIHSTCPVHFILLELTALTVLLRCTNCRSPPCNLSHHRSTSSFLGPNNFSITSFSNTLSSCSFCNIWDPKFHIHIRQQEMLYNSVHFCSLMFLHSKWEDKISVKHGSRHSSYLICCRFFHACNFDLLMTLSHTFSSPHCRKFYSHRHVVILYCMMLTRDEHILTVLYV